MLSICRFCRSDGFRGYLSVLDKDMFFIFILWVVRLVSYRKSELILGGLSKTIENSKCGCPLILGGLSKIIENSCAVMLFR